MNEEILQLNEESLSRYLYSFVPNYEKRKKELEILITNLPQKHSFANYITEELCKSGSIESISEQEKEILSSSSKDYYLLTNAVIYFERRWNTKTIRKILELSLSPERYRVLIDLVIDTEEEEVEKSCSIEPFTLSVPDDFKEIENIYLILNHLKENRIIQSIRDTFTSYKILQVYKNFHIFSSSELYTLAKLERVSFKDIAGAIVLSLSISDSSPIYCSNVLETMYRKNKVILSSFIQLFISLYNGKDHLWEKIQDIVPYLYLNLFKERETLHPLLYCLNIKNTVLIFELFNGNIPEMEIFDGCKEGRVSVPSDRIRKQVQSLLLIEQSKTYSTPPLKNLSFSSPSPHHPIFTQIIENTSPSITHFNNILLDHKSMLKNLAEEDVNTFVYLLLSSSNSLTYKELALAILHQMLNDG